MPTVSVDMVGIFDFVSINHTHKTDTEKHLMYAFKSDIILLYGI